MNLVYLFLLSLGFSILTCDTNSVYVKFSKKNGKSSYPESFEVWNNTNSLYTSPVFSTQGNQDIEYCLPATTNSRYLIKLAPSSSSEWFQSSSLILYGRYGNIVFKDNLHHVSVNGSYPFSLHYAVKKDVTWKLKSGDMPESWTNVYYSDNLWNTMTLGTASQQLTGTQYFRKSFSGMIDMAAYEMKLNYRYGVVAYINGNEIFRDNMNTGTVTSSTLASNSYTFLEYRGCVRPGKEVESTQNVLAVELHFLDLTTSNPVTFNAFLAMLVSPTSESNCFVYPYTVFMQSSPTNQDVSNSFDFNYDSFSQFDAFQLPVAVNITIFDTKGYINGFRFWPGTGKYSLPGSFTIHGKSSSNQLYLISNVKSLSPKESSFVYSYMYISLDLYSSYHFTINSVVNGTTLNLYELQPLICSHTATTFIEYQSLLFVFYVGTSAIHVQPINELFTNCQITPSPPTGFSFNSTTCSLDGSMSSPLSLLSFVVTSTMNGVVYTGYFSLEVVKCGGTLVQFTRQYGLSLEESFTVTDTDSGGIVVQVDDSSHDLYEVKEYTYCLYGSHYTVTTSAVGNMWSSNSFLLVSAILDISQTDPIVRIRYDSALGLPSVTTFSIQYVVQPMEEWWYLMGSVPSGWYGSSFTGWTVGASPNYPDSTNAIQLYKKIVTISSLETIVSLMVSVKFNNDFILYINGYPVFNRYLNSFTGTSTGSHHLTDSVFHQIAIPIRTIGSATTPSIQYVVEGNNTIAFGFASSSVTDVESVFDCAIRLMESSNRGMNTAIETMSVSGSVTSILNDSSSTMIGQTTCGPNTIDIAFENERYEWINAITLRLAENQDSEYVTQLTIMGKNEFDTTWTVIREVQDIEWSLSNRKIHIWLPHGSSYTHLRLQNLSTGNSSSCSWKLGNIQLLTTLFSINAPSTLYPNELHLVKDLIMEPLYPESDMYYSFSVSPSLPPGILFDSITGGLSGTPTSVMTALPYTFTARTLNGTLVTSVVSIVVELCAKERGFFTVTVYQEIGMSLFFRIHQGRGTNGTVIHLVDDIPRHGVRSSFNFCLPNGIYTLYTWDNDVSYHMGDGYSLSVDNGQFRFAMATNERVAGPTYQGFDAITFSSLIPFQMEYSEWKVFTTQEMYNDAWKAINYDDSDWPSMKASAIGTSEFTTIYIRKIINIPNMEDYHVLNVRVKYTGGVAVHFNGLLNSRFGIPPDDFNIFTVSPNYDIRYSLFHVILTAFNGVAGTNIITFELHRYTNQTFDMPFIFDATGVFGVSECSPVVDSEEEIIGVLVTNAETSILNDFDPVTIGSHNNFFYDVNIIYYRYDNQEGSMMNAFSVHTPRNYSSWSFRVRGTFTTMQNLLDTDTIETPSNGYTVISVPSGMNYLDSVAVSILTSPSPSQLYVSEIQALYCVPPKNGSCERIGDFYGVGNGEVSRIPCPFGYIGRQSRVCNNGVFSEPDTTYCQIQHPQYLHYSSSHYELVVGVPVDIPAPLYIYRIDSFFVDLDTPLPEGLMFNTTTGAVTGTVTTVFSPTNYTIYGRNGVITVHVSLSLSARLAECPESDGFPRSSAGSFYIRKCESIGDYVGIQSRACLVGEEDGEWSPIVGECYLTADYMPANLVYHSSPLVVGVGHSVNASCSIDGNLSYFHVVEGILPSGLQLDSENGTIYGIPTKRGESVVMIVAENVAGSTNTTLEIKVMEPAGDLQYEETSFSITVDKFFTTTPSYKGDEVSFTLIDGSLPEGLKLDEKSGVISGTPTVLIADLSCEIVCLNAFGSSKTRVTFTVEESSAVVVVIVVILIILVVGAVGYGGYVFLKRRKHMIPKVTTQSTQEV